MGTALLGQLVNSPQFAQIKQLIRSNPAALQPIMAQLQQSSPQLYSVIFIILFLVNSFKSLSILKIDS